MLVRVLAAPIRWYQRYLSPLKATASCRYLPTCSSYALEALERHGALVGSGLAVLRVLRCNPLFHGGYHPVMQRRHAAACLGSGCTHDAAQKPS